jgi:hypothetical protein
MCSKAAVSRGQHVHVTAVVYWTDNTPPAKCCHLINSEITEESINGWSHEVFVKIDINVIGAVNGLKKT